MGKHGCHDADIQLDQMLSLAKKEQAGAIQRDRLNVEGAKGLADRLAKLQDGWLETSRCDGMGRHDVWVGKNGEGSEVRGVESYASRECQPMVAFAFVQSVVRGGKGLVNDDGHLAYVRTKSKGRVKYRLHFSVTQARQRHYLGVWKQRARKAG